MIEVRALTMFLALAEELHFGRTADRLGVAQSVLSSQILRIEDRIGIRLFERGRRSAVTLTTAGRTFLAEARLAVTQLERAERIGRMVGRGEAGPVRIGFVMSAALGGFLTRALAAIRKELPAIEVHAGTMDSPDQIAAVSDGRLDLGFIRPRLAYPDNVEARAIHLDDMLVVLSEEHPLTAKARVSSADLANETFIYPRFPDADRFAEIVGKLSGAPRDDTRNMITRDFVTAISLAAAGYGVVVAPRSIGSLGIDGVALRDLTDNEERVALTLISRRSWNPTLMAVLERPFPKP